MNNLNKPFAESSEQNKQVILDIIKPVLESRRHVLEIGSGTGQHAVFFAEQMPHLLWQPTDLKEALPGINSWITDSALNNIKTPIELDAERSRWPFEQLFDAVFTANTAHIMSITAVEAMFAGVGQVLEQGALFCIYGPFNYHGKFTSESNARFELWLKQRDPRSGIRDIDDLIGFADNAGLCLHEDVEMPANNRILIWRKT